MDSRFDNLIERMRINREYYFSDFAKFVKDTVSVHFARRNSAYHGISGVNRAMQKTLLSAFFDYAVKYPQYFSRTEKSDWHEILLSIKFMKDSEDTILSPSTNIVWLSDNTFIDAYGIDDDTYYSVSLQRKLNVIQNLHEASAFYCNEEKIHLSFQDVAYAMAEVYDPVSNTLTQDWEINLENRIQKKAKIKKEMLQALSDTFSVRQLSKALKTEKPDESLKNKKPRMTFPKWKIYCRFAVRKLFSPYKSYTLEEAFRVLIAVNERLSQASDNSFGTVSSSHTSYGWLHSQVCSHTMRCVISREDILSAMQHGINQLIGEKNESESIAFREYKGEIAPIMAKFKRMGIIGEHLNFYETCLLREAVMNQKVRPHKRKEKGWLTYNLHIKLTEIGVSQEKISRLFNTWFAYSSRDHDNCTAHFLRYREPLLRKIFLRKMRQSSPVLDMAFRIFTERLTDVPIDFDTIGIELQLQVIIGFYVRKYAQRGDYWERAAKTICNGVNQNHHHYHYHGIIGKTISTLLKHDPSLHGGLMRGSISLLNIAKSRLKYPDEQIYYIDTSSMVDVILQHNISGGLGILYNHGIKLHSQFSDDRLYSDLTMKLISTESNLAIRQDQACFLIAMADEKLKIDDALIESISGSDLKDTALSLTAAHEHAFPNILRTLLQRHSDITPMSYITICPEWQRPFIIEKLAAA